MVIDVRRREVVERTEVRERQGGQAPIGRIGRNALNTEESGNIPGVGETIDALVMILIEADLQLALNSAERPRVLNTGVEAVPVCIAADCRKRIVHLGGGPLILQLET